MPIIVTQEDEGTLAYRLGPWDGTRLNVPVWLAEDRMNLETDGLLHGMMRAWGLRPVRRRPELRATEYAERWSAPFLRLADRAARAYWASIIGPLRRHGGFLLGEGALCGPFRIWCYFRPWRLRVR